MKRLFLLFLLLASSITHAATTPAIAWYNLIGSQWSSSNASMQFSSKELACKWGFDESGHPSKQTYNLSGNTCTIIHQNGATISEQPVYTVYACPPNTTNDAGGTPNASTQCTIPSCPEGQTWSTVTSSCAADCTPKKGQKYDFSVNGANIPSSVCLPDQCAGNVFYSSSACTSSACFGIGSAIYTGNSCAGQASIASLNNPTNQQPPPTDKPETNCVKQGQSFGTVNGVVVCVPKSSAGAAPTKTTGQTSTETKDTDSQGNTTTTGSDTKSESTLDGGQVITKSEVTNSDGTKKEETKTQTYVDFCNQNPSHQICKSKQEEEEGADICEDNPDRPECYNRGEAADTDTIGSLTRTVSFSPVTITSGGSCPPDKSVSIAGNLITFSYTWLCNYASMFKPFMIAFAYLSAAMFLFWGYKGAQA